MPGATDHHFVRLFSVAVSFRTAIFSTRSDGAQTSAGLPLQELLISPASTLKSLFRFLPKLWPTALNAFKALLSQTVQLPFISSCGIVEVLLYIFNNLIIVLLSCENFSLMLLIPRLHVILDCN